MPQPRFLLAFPLCLLLFLGAVRASCAQAVPMTADRWVAGGNATFDAGVLDVVKGSVEAKDVVFDDGTIEFDMFMPARGILGLRLRAQDRENAEALYFRPQPDCATAPDCMQYMPLEHGAFEWDLFPEYQAPAPLHLLAWNHFRIVLLGATMQVYVNHASAPSLRVDHMEGPARPGALLFGGPAKYAHLLITPAPSDGFLRHWQVSTATNLPTVHDPVLDVPMGVRPAYAAMPPPGAAWHAVTAQAKGLINFSREVGSAKDGATISLAWAKTTLVSDRAQTKTVKIGWVREVWVYVNGVLVYDGRNLDGLPAAQAAGGRIALANGTFQLPLKAGRNNIAIALDDNLPGNTQHFGWGVELQLQDLDGVELDLGSVSPPAATTMAT